MTARELQRPVRSRRRYRRSFVLFLVLMVCAVLSLMLEASVPIVEETTMAHVSLMFSIGAIVSWAFACGFFMRLHLWKCPRCRKRFFVGPHTHSRWRHFLSPWYRMRLGTRLRLMWRYAFRQLRCEHCRVRLSPLRPDLAA
jgi:hypothetical protein